MAQAALLLLAMHAGAAGAAQPDPGQEAPAAGPPATAPARDPRGPHIGRARLRGVVNADDGRPLRHAQVRLSGTSVPEGQSTTTDREGAYEFRGLPAGRYVVTASKAGFVSLQYGQPRAQEPGRPVDVAVDQAVEGIDFALPRGGVIVGRVVDDAGEPVADALVNALRFEYARGRRRLVPVNAGRGPARTNDLGEFRLPGLAPGDYYVAASLGGAFNESAGAAPSLAYARTYYPGTQTLAEAQAVSVATGQDAAASMALLPARLVYVTGAVLDSAGRPLSGGLLRLDQRGEDASSGRMARVGPDGSFRVEVLASPGVYTLSAVAGESKDPDAPRGAEMGRIQIPLGSSHVDGVQIVTSPGATVSGHVVFEGNTANGAPRVRVFSQPLDAEEAVGGGGSAPLNRDGTFELRNVFGQSLLLADVAGSRTWRVKGVYVDGQDVTDRGLDVTARQRVAGARIVLTDRLTRLSGQVQTPSGQAGADHVVVLFADGEEKWRHPQSRHVSVTRADREGRYVISGMPAGKYFAAAASTFDVATGLQPEALARLRPGAQRVTLVDGESTQLNLEID